MLSCYSVWGRYYEFNRNKEKAEICEKSKHNMERAELEHLRNREYKVYTYDEIKKHPGLLDYIIRGI